MGPHVAPWGPMGAPWGPHGAPMGLHGGPLGSHLGSISDISDDHIRGEYGEGGGFKDPVWCFKPIAPLASYYQIVDTVMVREKLHMVNFYVDPDNAPNASATE